MVQMLVLVEFVVLEKRQLSGRISVRCRETGSVNLLCCSVFTAGLAGNTQAKPKILLVADEKERRVVL